MYKPPLLDAFDVLNMAHPMAYQSHFIEFYANGVFSDAYLLQITWNQQTAVCHKTTWLKNQPVYTLCQESGQLEVSSIEKISVLWQDLALTPQFYAAKIGRDGHLFRLTIGQRNTSVSYQWYEVMIPDQWEALIPVSQAFQSLAAQWQSEQKQHYLLTYSEEETEQGSMYASWEKTPLKI